MLLNEYVPGVKFLVILLLKLLKLAGFWQNCLIGQVEISQKIRVDGEVNRARCMPQNPTLVGTKTSSCEVYVFDYVKQAAKQQDGCDPDLRLRGHDKEGYGLSWSPFKEGYLVSGSHDQKICLWDVSALPQDKVLDAMHIYEVISGLPILCESKIVGLLIILV